MSLNQIDEQLEFLAFEHTLSEKYTGLDDARTARSEMGLFSNRSSISLGAVDNPLFDFNNSPWLTEQIERAVELGDSSGFPLGTPERTLK